MKIWILTMAAMAPGTAHAADMSFSIDDVRLTAPIPAGYCIPTGRDKTVADLVAKGDAENLTLATLIRCDQAGRAEGFGNDYMLIKTPIAAMGVRLQRAEFLQALAAEFGKADWQSGQLGAQATDDAAKNVSDTLKTPIEIKGEIKPRGTDEDCAYLGGSVNVTGAGVAYPIILGGCMTTAGDKVLAVYSYGDPGTGGGVAGKMRSARAVARTIRQASQ